MIQALLNGLLDDHLLVRTACAKSLAQLGQHFPELLPEIEQRLVQAIEDPAFAKLDTVADRSGHDYAFDGLWLLINGEETTGVMRDRNAQAINRWEMRLQRE